MEKRTPKTQEEARQYAIDWQNFISENSVYQSELVDWQYVFEKIAVEFDLVDEFKENGII